MSRGLQETLYFGKGGEYMNITDSILENIRTSVGLTKDNKEFDVELTNHINMSIVKLNQNGVGRPILVDDETTTWLDLLDPLDKGYDAIGLIPTFISLNVKLLFDPPPPSSVEFHTRSVDELLWRLKIAYEQEVED